MAKYGINLTHSALVTVKALLNEHWDRTAMSAQQAKDVVLTIEEIERVLPLAEADTQAAQARS